MARLLASGTRFDALAPTAILKPDYLQLDNKPWDTSAGVLIAREAGARVLDHDGSEQTLPRVSLTIAATPRFEGELIAAVHAALAE